MSPGSFWRSPSEVMISRPRAWAKPAANAAVWPKLRRNRITRTRASRAWTAARRSKLSSVLPSSTNRISYGRPVPWSAAVSSSTSCAMFGDSFRIGMTTDSSGVMTPQGPASRSEYALAGLRGPPQASRPGAPEPPDQHGRGRDDGQIQAGPRAVPLDVLDGALAEPERDQSLTDIAHGPP